MLSSSVTHPLRKDPETVSLWPLIIMNDPYSALLRQVSLYCNNYGNTSYCMSCMFTFNHKAMHMEL